VKRGGTLEDVNFFKANDALVGNFPAEIFGLATLLVVLLEEDGAARITNERAGSRKANIPGAILDFDSAAKKSRVTGHISSFLRGSPRVNSTKGLMRKILWKLFHVVTKNSIRGKNLGFFQTSFEYKRKTASLRAMYSARSKRRSPEVMNFFARACQEISRRGRPLLGGMD
jgi:hypothetical protein